MATNREQYEVDKKRVGAALKAQALKIIQDCPKSSPIARGSLCFRLRCTDRTARLAIAELRADGHPICSDSTDHGYFWPETWAEYEEFAAREYGAKIAHMSQIKAAMDSGARERFNGVPKEIKQASLF